MVLPFELWKETTSRTRFEYTSKVKQSIRADPGDRPLWEPLRSRQMRLPVFKTVTDLFHPFGPLFLHFFFFLLLFSFSFYSFL
jgi:hypothetical protein